MKILIALAVAAGLGYLFLLWWRTAPDLAQLEADRGIRDIEDYLRQQASAAGTD